jgi:hypothetical protein
MATYGVQVAAYGSPTGHLRQFMRSVESPKKKAANSRIRSKSSETSAFGGANAPNPDLSMPRKTTSGVPQDSLRGPRDNLCRHPQLAYPHFESPQFKQVLQPSIMTTAAVLHFAHSCAPSGKCDFENASVCLVRASNSARFSSTNFR